MQFLKQIHQQHAADAPAASLPLLLLLLPLPLLLLLLSLPLLLLPLPPADEIRRRPRCDAMLEDELRITKRRDDFHPSDCQRNEISDGMFALLTLFASLNVGGHSSLADSSNTLVLRLLS